MFTLLRKKTDQKRFLDWFFVIVLQEYRRKQKVITVSYNIVVYVVLAQYFEFIGLMDHLYELGLLDTGEYFVVGVCLAESDTITPDAYLKGTVG